MLTLIGLTLVFAGLTSALGIPRAARALLSKRVRAVDLLPLATHVAMTLWFLAAGAWAMVVRVCVG